MMKPLTLFGLACLLTTQAQGAEPQVSAAAPTASSAVSVAESAIASPPAVSAAEPVAVSQPAVSAAGPVASYQPEVSAAGPAAPLPVAPSMAQPAATATASDGGLSPTSQPMTSTPTSGVDDSGNLQAVPLYRQDELLNWIEQGRHLQQVKQDRCQLTQDIEVRAEVMKVPAYQFLWGDMLAWGVCIKPNAELGVKFMWEAANQGLAPALEQLGRYYWKGTLVQKDLLKAETLMREAASLGFQRAQVEWVEMLLQGLGSPLDYEEAYHWLHSTVIGDKALHQKATSLLNRLGNRMPANAIARAKAMR
ncbi:sel1 repeat family protein [Aeromonas salmonicida subsp. achromogenes]|nr:flagellar motor protein [Aeromonas salmonicida]AYO61966.1 flagellar motor protein [Aeromonas salmonicida subsp. salmonicida 01-B526]QEO85248.1 sel1 repeat family protein [Aeromonas salmonicida subsp. salmonicida]TMX06293.1 sel1 repeat family protein [Aeromonas salmonicida subsp. achromogenes]ASI26485.1 flagellar motor protein [Aeromonas salmonicida]